MAPLLPPTGPPDHHVAPSSSTRIACGCQIEADNKSPVPQTCYVCYHDQQKLEDEIEHGVSHQQDIAAPVPVETLQALASVAENFSEQNPIVKCIDCGAEISPENASCLKTYCASCFRKNVQENQAKLAQSLPPTHGWGKRERESEQHWFARVQAGKFPN